MDFTPSGKPIYITLLEEFKRCPPRFFTATSTSHGNPVLRHDPARINVCDRSQQGKSMFPDTMGGVLVITTETELQQLTARLLERPIFFTVSIERSASEVCSKVTHTTRGRLAVFVNTQHPHVHHLIQSQLAQCMDTLKQGKNFAVEFDFNDVFVTWMKAVYQEADLQTMDCGCNIKYSCSSGKVTVTNYSEFEEIFACTPSLLVMFVVCLPCCLLTFPFYRIHRAVNVEDFGGKVTGLQPSYWSAEAEMQGMEEILSRVLQLIAQDNAAEVRTPDMPPSYDAATGSNLAYGGSQVVNRQPGYPQPVGQQVGYGQPVVQQPGYAVPMGQHPGYAQTMAQQPGYAQTMAQQPGYAQTMAQQPGYPQPMVGQQPGYARPVVQ
ncbi:uncharacterized protein LOC119737465 [Patiria miniata]|uniref:Uncharacterized protein n=1 Tax=Patiria miniata TaxID=46514 RepID=A0A914AVI8_PATMI|nr:uncharacterized protein LOC119737465 [Patiria miniata]